MQVKRYTESSQRAFCILDRCLSLRTSMLFSRWQHSRVFTFSFITFEMNSLNLLHLSNKSTVYDYSRHSLITLWGIGVFAHYIFNNILSI